MKKFFRILADLAEVYVPTLLFAIMFVMFIVQIVYRYFFDMQMAWQNEVIVVAFSWTMILSASHGTRTESHVSFSTLYDALNEKWKTVIRLAGNLIQIVCILLILKPTWNTVMFYKMVKTPILKLPMNYYYFPFIIFIVLTFIHLAVQTSRDVIKLFGKQSIEQGGRDA